MNKNRFFTKIILLAVLSTGTLLSQGSGYLAQKFMVENDLRQRITDALSKLIDDRKYVIDVKAEIEITDGTEEQITILDEGQPQDARQSSEVLSSEIRESLDTPTSTTPSYSSGLPIPGFEFESDGGPATTPALSEPAPNTSNQNQTLPSTSNNKILSRTVTNKHPSAANITKLDISIILQEGAAPELIENIRQVVMVASGFSRSRGDALSIMTATFKERRDEKTAEQILLKNIAEKLESLEQQQTDERGVNWKNELENYKAEEADRRKQDKDYFQQQLTNLEATAKERAYQAEKRDILKRDSLKLQALNKEIESLKAMLASSEVPEDVAAQAQNAMGEKLSEKDKLDAQITEKLAKLDAVQTDLDRMGGTGSSTTMIVFISLLGALVIILVVVMVIMMMGNKQKQQLPPPWMYPPRPRKKKSKEEPITASAQSVTPPQKGTPMEDTAVLQSEVSDMRQAVVSMSVSQPNTATKIVKEWMEDETPPPEPEPATPEPVEEDTGGKKNKKKKK